LKKGDRIAAYLPMIPELPIFMLAVARLGVIFTVVFAGFTTESLAPSGRGEPLKTPVSPVLGYDEDCV